MKTLAAAKPSLLTGSVWKTEMALSASSFVTLLSGPAALAPVKVRSRNRKAATNRFIRKGGVGLEGFASVGRFFCASRSGRQLAFARRSCGFCTLDEIFSE